MTGAVVGLALVGLTWAGLHACTSVRGTPSCGTPGVLLLLVITVAVVVLGSLLLRLAGVAAHGSTSLLGVALLVVLVLLALLPVLGRVVGRGRRPRGGDGHLHRRVVADLDVRRARHGSHGPVVPTGRPVLPGW